VRAIVIEDSRLARRGLIRMLSKHPSISVVGEAEHPSDARELIAVETPDLLFLDIHMPGESGLELLASLDYSPKVIFTTAYPDYAIRSFEHDTVDYLLKPVSEDRLEAAIAKLRSDQTVVKPVPLEAALTLDSRIFVQDGDACHLVVLNTIEYIESCKNYVRIFFEGKKAFVKKSMTQVEQRLPSNVFFRANRQMIVNLQAIAGIEESVGEGYDLRMKDGTVVETSRRNTARLKELLSL